MEETIAAGIALARNGADLIEIGIPYSDPVMDGQVIQAATAEALAEGFSAGQVFDVVAGITSETDVAVLVMTYWNPVVRMGVDEFSRRLTETGGAGLITPDLIPDEAAEWMEASEKYGLDRVFLVRPLRLQIVCSVRASCGFVYAGSNMGVTGSRASVSSAATDVVAAARAAGAERVCAGLGVSNAEQVAEIAVYADGVIVGSALVSALHESGVDAIGFPHQGPQCSAGQKVAAIMRSFLMGPATIPSPHWSGFHVPLPWGSPRSTACRSPATEDCRLVGAPANSPRATLGRLFGKLAEDCSA